MLGNRELRELISVTKSYINLTETVIEKDYYVTQVIHALSGIENDYFRLVFAGGTCLAKAHKIIKRMSEDVENMVHLLSFGSLVSLSLHLTYMNLDEYFKKYH